MADEESMGFIRLGTNLAVSFVPELNMQKSDGLSFASRIERFADNVKFESSEWQFSNRRGNVSVIVTPSLIEMTHANLDVAMEQPLESTMTGLEYAEIDFTHILSAFRENFQPRVIAGVRVVSSFLLDTREDARSFLSETVLGFEPTKLSPLQRVVQGIGFKLVCPPFSGKLPDGQNHDVDWGVDLKVESWLRNPRYVFVEADSEWGEPCRWENDIDTSLMERIGCVASFVNENVRQFLMQSDHSGDEVES